jgi:hypothetical protein
MSTSSKPILASGFTDAYFGDSEQRFRKMAKSDWIKPKQMIGLNRNG